MKADPACRFVRFVAALPVLLLLSLGNVFGAEAPAALEATCPSCDDFNGCTIDSCDATTGTCRHDPLICEDDGDPCTVDICQSFPGSTFHTCHHSPAVGAPCNDGNSCTIGETCQNIVGGGMECRGTIQPEGTACEDGNACTSSDTCSVEAICVGTSSAVGSPCDDHNLCTSDEVCVASPAGPPTCVGALKNCDDADPCTQNVCDPGTGQCAPVNCNDGNPCTADSCDAATGQCVRTYVTGGCSDGNPCTLSDSCSSGNCTPGTPNPCSDDRFCTRDTCSPSTGCISFPDNSLCPPDSACAHWVCNGCNFTGGFCSGGCQNLTSGGFRECDGNPCTIFDECVRSFCRPGSPTKCLDSNPCTDNLCDPATGNCSFPNNTTPCNDGNACTAGDVCSNGTCQSGTPVSCDDANACTADSCGATGCAHSDITASCNDQDVCTIDTCDPGSGCVHQPVTSQTTCGVGACRRTVDICIGGVPQTCVPGAPTPEVCNGIDDDCDGLVDENRVQIDCTISPATMNLNSQGGSVSMTCKLQDVCDPANPFPISGSTVSQVYVSRVDSADDPGDDVTLPDPLTLPCPDPVLGFLYERGISENLEARDVSNANVTFKFNLPSDGDCATLDGNRQDIAARLASVPDNTSATICISGKAGAADFQACMLVLVKNKGLR